MKPLRFICLSFALLLVTSAFTPTAQAQFPGFGYPYAWGGGQFGLDGLRSNDRVLPYFSLYPPVYYSQSVPRPYGYSPFALPPGVQPAEAIVKPAAPKQVKVINPYFRPNKDKKEDAGKPVTTAKLIVNPFVKQPGQLDDQRLVRSENRKVREE